MSDPAMEAARRAFADYWPDQGDFEFSHSNEGRLSMDAAHEALKPLRALSEKLRAAAGAPPTVFDAEYDVGNAFDDGVLSVLDEIAPLIYAAEELK